MIPKSILRPSNRRIRLVVGVLVAGLLCVQCTRSEAFRESRFVVVLSGEAFGANSPDVSEEVVRLAQSDHIALLEYCLAGCEDRYRDYTCTLIKQERIGGRVTNEQEIAVKFMASPFSVAMAWTPETAGVGDRVVYVDGKYTSSAKVEEGGRFVAVVDPSETRAIELRAFEHAPGGRMKEARIENVRPGATDLILRLKALK